MNRTKIISNDELRLILGNSSLSDGLASVHNQISINILCDILQVNELVDHSVEKEEIEITSCGSVLEFRDFPVDSSSIELYNKLNVRIDDQIEYRGDSHSNQILHLVNSAGAKVSLGYKTGHVLANYDGGYNNYDTLELLANASEDENLIINEAGTETTYLLKSSPTTDEHIQIGATKEDTTTNIAAKLGGSAVGAVVTFLVGQTIFTTTMTATVVNSDMPEDLKFACALIAGGSISNAERSNGVISYKLGQKTVNFRSEGEAETAKKILENYIGKYSPITILS